MRCSVPLPLDDDDDDDADADAVPPAGPPFRCRRSESDGRSTWRCARARSRIGRAGGRCDARPCHGPRAGRSRPHCRGRSAKPAVGVRAHAQLGMGGWPDSRRAWRRSSPGKPTVTARPQDTGRPVPGQGPVLTRPPAGGHVRTTRPSSCRCAVTGRDRLGRRPGALAPFSVRQYPAR